MSQMLAFTILVCVLVVAGVTDVRSGKVYNWLTYPAMLGGLAYWLIAGLLGTEAGGLAGFLAALAGLAAGLVPSAIVFAGGGLGGGDVKLMGAVGALSASWQVVLGTAVYALVLAAVIAVVVMIRHRLVKRTLGRVFGAALAAAARTKPQIPSDSPRIAFSAAIALGGIVAAGEQMLGWQTPWRWLAP